MPRRILVTLFALIVVVGVATPLPAFATAGATIHGTLTMPDGSVPDGNNYPEICGQSAGTSGCGNFGSSTVYDSSTGAYSISGLQAGTYQVGFLYQGSSTSVLSSTWWGGGSSLSDAPTHVVTAGQDIPLDLSFVAGAVITGGVTGADATLPSASVVATPASGVGSYPGVFTAATQSYQISRLPAGSYKISFSSDPHYQTRYWNNSSTLTAATQVAVVAGQTVTGIDAVLPHSTSVSGHLFVDDGSGAVPRQGYVDLVLDPSGGQQSAFTTSGVDGAYEFDNVTPGTYRVCAEGFMTVIGNCWGGGDETTAPTITVAADQVITGKDITVTVGGVVTATVKTLDQVGDTPVALAGADVDLWKLNDAGTFYDFFSELTTDTGGNVSAEQLPVGTYRIEFRDPAGNYSSEWWNNQRYFAPSDDIVVGTNSTTNLGDVVLLPRTLDVSRTFGQDRFSGAVQMTQAIWAPPVETPGNGGVPDAGVPIIYIANGLNYPDALSAGPAAIVQQGALLLVLPTSIPDVVKTELTRLHPQKIVIVGGPASVSPAVEAQLADYSPDVRRQSGADRFEASRNLAESVWGGPSGPGAPAVFISTGLNFPDALDAGPAAGLIDAPVILVNGSLSTLDPGTLQLLSDLGTINVFIAGGPGSVSPGIEAQLTDLMGANHVHRFTGATRYDAAAAINAWFFPTAETVFLATGANFPDALAGAPLAGAAGGPIYLAQPSCIPQIVAIQIIEGDTQGVWLLGGPASLTPAVEDLTLCAS